MKRPLLLAVLLLALGPAARAESGIEEVAVLQSGQYYGTVEAYRSGADLYLWAKDAAAVFGAQLYWRQV